jgi:hypothetical protein
MVSAVAFELSAASGGSVSVSLFDGRGDVLYASGALADGRYGFEAREAFTEVLTSAVHRVTLGGTTNTVLWTVGHATDAGVPDFAYRGWRLATPYEGWSFLIADPAQRGPSSDPDGDGAPNLVEYATATDPANSLSLPRLTGALTNGGFDVRFTRANVADVSWYLDATTNLSAGQTWTPIATRHGDQPWAGTAPVDEIADGASETVVVHNPMAGFASHYLRLRVTQP